jgi:hypothetical protein
MAAVTAKYQVRARRWARGWELHIDGVGVTQSASLADAESMVRDYIALDLDVEPDSFDVEITPEVGDDLDQAISDVRRKIAEAAKAQSRAAEESRALVRRLAAKGLSGKDTAHVLGVSPQRVSQLLRTDKAGHRKRSTTTRCRPKTPTR